MVTLRSQQNNTVDIPGGYSYEFLVGVYRPVLQILTLFQTKKCHFLHPFLHLAFREKLCSLLELEHKQNIFSNAFRIFLFPSYSFGIETINTFIRFRSSLENHARFQNKIGKVYTRFQTKTAQKPHPWGWHIPIKAYIRLYPPPPLSPTTPEDIQQLFERILL